VAVAFLATTGLVALSATGATPAFAAGSTVTYNLLCDSTLGGAQTQNIPFAVTITGVATDPVFPTGAGITVGGTSMTVSSPFTDGFAGSLRRPSPSPIRTCSVPRTSQEVSRRTEQTVTRHLGRST
jgi:hypothetical protein